jgi:hypothetical protein
VKLKIAEDLALPADEAVTQKYGFIGRSGSGKSYAAMRLAELFLEQGAQIIALDWVGIWWSLRLAADGKAPGFEHVYIFGGEHADVDLRPESGALMADLVVDKHISVVLDVMHFRKAERTRFATAFAEQFFHRKKTARTACHLFIEEAQAYLPQMVRGEEARMVGVFEDIGKVGRNYGIGNSLISQRPQAINKDVLNQVEVLLAFQTNGPQERKAIAGWTAENTDAGAALVQELPKLHIGHAQVWSPQWLRVAKQVHISTRVTYDASSTPSLKAKTIRPKTLAPADLAALGEQITATIEKAKADDPRELRKQIANLQQALKKSATPEKVSAPVREKIVERFVLKDGQLARAEKLVERLEALRDRVADHEEDLNTVAKEIRDAIALTRAPQPSPHRPVTPAPQSSGAIKAVVSVKRPPPSSSNGDGAVSGPQQRILNALAWAESFNLPTQRREKVAFLADASPKSSAFMNNLGALRSAGLIDYPTQGYVGLTDAGRELAHVDVGAPTSSYELQRAICSKLPTPQARIVDAVVRSYPSPLDRAAVAEAAGASPASSAFMNNLGALRSLGLLEYPSQGMVAASPVLFLEGQ